MWFLGQMGHLCDGGGGVRFRTVGRQKVRRVFGLFGGARLGFIGFDFVYVCSSTRVCVLVVGDSQSGVN